MLNTKKEGVFMKLQKVEGHTNDERNSRVFRKLLLVNKALNGI